MPASTCSPVWPCRETFLKETRRLPKPKATPAGRFSHAGALFKGVAGPAIHQPQQDEQQTKTLGLRFTFSQLLTIWFSSTLSLL